MHDCLIIGGGVIGLSLAYELAGHGMSVRLLERGEPGREASWAGAGMLPPDVRRNSSDAMAELAGLSHELHPRWSADLREQTGIDNGFRRTGAIYVARDQDSTTALYRQADVWKARGIRAQQLDAESLMSLEPTLHSPIGSNAPNGQAAAFLLPEECQLRNPRHLKALVAGCLQRGVEITSGEAAEDFEMRGGRVHAVRTSSGSIQAGYFCLTAGCWTGSLISRLGVATALRPVRGQIVMLKTPAQKLKHILNEGTRYLVPRPDGRTLVGSTEEDVGFECHTTAEAIAELLGFALASSSALQGATVERSWAGLRPSTPDGLPYLGRLPGLENAWTAAGHFRHGLRLSPATAVVMAEVVRGEKPQIDLTPFRVDRPC